MHIDPSHPRASSLKIRERLVWGVKKGLTSTAGLLAHGRGEAFDYLLGEKTHDFARKAIKAAAAYLLLAKKPIISTNGNSSVLTAREFVELAKLLDCQIEVNLFHFSKTRQKQIENYFHRLSRSTILRSTDNTKTVLPNIASHRKYSMNNGIASADVILVPLEDGDRCEALIAMGKKVITIDLNPLSRTAQSATVTIADNIVRAMPLLCKTVEDLEIKPNDSLLQIISDYDNLSILSEAITFIEKRLNKIAGMVK